MPNGDQFREAEERGVNPYDLARQRAEEEQKRTDAAVPDTVPKEWTEGTEGKSG
jgi:hypothetical protein